MAEYPPLNELRKAITRWRRKRADADHALDNARKAFEDAAVAFALRSIAAKEVLTTASGEWHWVAMRERHRAKTWKINCGLSYDGVPRITLANYPPAIGSTPFEEVSPFIYIDGFGARLAFRGIDHTRLLFPRDQENEQQTSAD